MFANSLIPRRVCGTSALGDEFDKLFGHVLSAPQGRLSTYQSGDWQARMAVWEKENDLHLELEDSERIEHYNERRVGRFERVVRLPQQFDPESVAAELSDGVLHVTVTKTPEAQPKKIEVK